MYKRLINYFTGIDGPLCYKYSTLMKNYLDRSDVKEALGVESSTNFELCNNAVNAAFQGSGDWMRPYVYQLTPLLNNNISVLAYAGDADFICNWMGIRAWTMELPWYGREDYNRQKDSYWYSNDQKEAAGMIRKSGSLTFIRLFNAGHMAPWDQPQATLDMFSRWISGDI
jgi:cathepsin A (carboxypeptidase C)